MSETTAMLSERKIIHFFANRGLQATTAITKGRNSRIAKFLVRPFAAHNTVQPVTLAPLSLKICPKTHAPKYICEKLHFRVQLGLRLPQGPAIVTGNSHQTLRSSQASLVIDIKTVRPIDSWHP